MNSIVKQSSIIAAGRIVLVFLIFIADALLSRHLGVSAKGEYYYIYNFIFTAAIILTGGVEYGNFYFFSKVKPKILLSNSLVYLFCISMAIWLLGPLILSHLQGLKDKSHLIILLTTAGVTLETIFIIVSSFILATGNTLSYIFARLIRRALFFLVLCCFFFTKSYTTVQSSILLYAISIFAGLVFLIWALRGYLPSRICLDFKLFCKTFYYGIKTHIGQIADQLHRRVGIFLLGIFATSSTIGLYSVAIGIAEVSLFVSNAASLALLSRANVDTKQLQQDTSLITRHTTVFALASVVVMAATGKLIISVCFGNAFIEAYFALLYTLPGVAMYSYYPSLKSCLINSGKAHLTMACGFFGLLTNIICNSILIPVWGLKGAALSLSLSYGLSSLLILSIAIKSSQQNISSYIFLTKEDILRFKTILKHMKSTSGKIKHV